MPDPPSTHDYADVQQPLIPADRDPSSEGAHPDPSAPIEEDTGVPSLFIWILTLCACISGLLFGYDTGVISSTLVSIGSDLSSRPLSTLDKSLITSATSLFALLASPVSGLLADGLGRKKVILIADVLFTLGALWQAVTSDVWGMIGGRSVVGLAVGSASFVVPLYIGELAPATWRGRLVTIVALFITGGQVVAYVIGWLFSSMGGGWRWMVGLGALPAFVQVVMLVWMPETPRWLIKHGREEGARSVLRKIYGKDRDALVKSIVMRVEIEIEEEDAALAKTLHHEAPASGLKASLVRIRDNFSELVAVPGHRRALTITCMLQGAQQLCGFNSLMYFSATIFALVGFTSPTLTSLTIACTNFAFTLVTFHFIDRIGRRRILLLSVPIMVLGLALCAIAFLFIQLPKHESSISSRAPIDHNAPPTGTHGPWTPIIVLSMVIYVASYALGLGNVPWQQSELFPLSVRSLGSALATATNWGSNFIIGVTFLPMMEVVTPTGTFAVYAVVCVGAWVCIWAIYPETAGLGLEDVGVLLRDGYGVKESLRAFEERRKARGQDMVREECVY